MPGVVVDYDSNTATITCSHTGDWSGSPAGCYVVECSHPVWNESAVKEVILAHPAGKLGIDFGLGTKVRYECKYEGEDFLFSRNILNVNMECGKE